MLGVRLSYIFILSLCLLFFVNLKMQARPIAPIEVDRVVDTAFYSKFKQDSEFQYVQYQKPNPWLQYAIIQWLNRIISEILEFESSYPIIRIIAVSAVIALLLMLIFRKQYLGLFWRENKNSSHEKFFWEEQNLNEPLDVLLKKALEGNRYNEAVRYMYLIVLSKLSVSGIIKLYPSQTVSEQLKMTQGSSYFQPLSEIAIWYQYVIFGNYEISETQFKNLYSIFVTNFEKLNSDAKI